MNLGLGLSPCIYQGKKPGTPVSPPGVASVSPAIGTVDGGTALTVLGNDFVNGCTATIGGVAAAVVFGSSGQLTITTPVGTSTGPQSLVITNPDAQTSGTSGDDQFSFTAAALTITGVSPSSGDPAGGTNVTITGTGFLGRGSAALGGVNIASFLVVDDETITGTTGAHAAGAVNTTVDGLASTAGLFTYNNPLLDLTTLPWRLFFHGADFTGGTPAWPGRASAGSSGSHSTTGGTKPVAGATQNGIQTVLWSAGKSLTTDQNPPTGDWSFIALYKFDPTGAANNPPASAYDNEGLLTDPGGNRFVMAVRPGKCQAEVYQFDFSGFVGDEAVATDNVYQLMQAKGDGTHVWVRQGSGAWTQFAAKYSLSGVPMSLGVSAGSGGSFKGNIALEALADTTFSDATFDAIVASINGEWGLSL